MKSSELQTFIKKECGLQVHLSSMFFKNNLYVGSCKLMRWMCPLKWTSRLMSSSPWSLWTKDFSLGLNLKGTERRNMRG